MLTKNDLKQIKSVVDESVEQKLKPINQKIDKLDTSMIKKLNTMQKSLDTTISYFDTVTTKHTKRIKRIEEHLNLPSIPDFA